MFKTFSLIGILALYSCISYGQTASDRTNANSPSTTNGDRLAIKKYIRLANAEMIRQTLIDNEEKNIPSQEKLLRNQRLYDSLLNITKPTYETGKVIYAPDSAFKLFRIEGGGCNYVTKTFLHFKSGKIIYPDKQNELKGLEIDPIISIVKFSRGIYGIFQHFEGCGNAHSDNYKVTQISIKGESLTYVPIDFKKAKSIMYDEFDNAKGTFSVWTVFYYSNPKTTFMKYHPKEKKISYSYVVSPNEFDRYHLQPELKPKEQQLLQVIGQIKVLNGKLILDSENYELIDEPVDENNH